MNWLTKRSFTGRRGEQQGPRSFYLAFPLSISHGNFHKKNNRTLCFLLFQIIHNFLRLNYLTSKIGTSTGKESRGWPANSYESIAITVKPFSCSPQFIRILQQEANLHSYVFVSVLVLSSCFGWTKEAKSWRCSLVRRLQTNKPRRGSRTRKQPEQLKDMSAPS